jgi:hypothetical protein
MEVIAKSKQWLKNYLTAGSKAASKFWPGTKLTNSICTSSSLETCYITQTNDQDFALIGCPVETASSERADRPDMQLFGTCLHCFVVVIETAPCDCPTGIVQSVLRLYPHQVSSFYEFSKFKLILQTGSRNCGLYIRGHNITLRLSSVWVNLKLDTGKKK